MQVRCIRAAYGHEVGALVEVPDGASVSPVYFEPVPAPAAGAPAAAAAGPAMPPPESAPVTPAPVPPAPTVAPEIGGA